LISARNDLNSPVPKFCLVLEASRRTTEGRVRTAHELVAHFFPYTETTSTDRLFHFLPPEVRGPILTAWGVRGQKSALRDSDEKVRAVVHDALVAGDVDARMFEASIAPEVVVRWLDLPDWWGFWRGGKLAKFSILKALESGYELGLFDAEWFLQTVASKDGKTRGTDVLAEGLSKADLTEWLRAIYVTADGSPRGIVAALGWDQIVSKTPDDVLIAVLDAIAIKVGLKEEAKPKKVESAPNVSPAATATPAATSAATPAATAPTANAPAATGSAPAATGSAPGDDAHSTSPRVSAAPAVPVSRAPEAPADAKPAGRKLPAILFPATARVNDPPPEPKIEPPPPPPAEVKEAAPADAEEIPISADAFEELAQPTTTARPEADAPPPPKGGKRPSKAPHGAKA